MYKLSESPATPASFMRGIAPGGRVQLFSPLGNKVAKSVAEADKLAEADLQEMERRLKRWPTHSEAMNGPKLQDDRTQEQREARQQFKPVVSENTHRLQHLVDLYDGEDHVMAGKTLKERISSDASRMIDREAVDSVARKAEAERRERIRPKLEKLEKLIDSEKWNPRGSQLLLDRLEMAREQLLCPDGCPEALARREGGIKAMLNERAELERAQRKAQIEFLESSLAAVKGGEQLE